MFYVTDVNRTSRTLTRTAPPSRITYDLGIYRHLSKGAVSRVARAKAPEPTKKYPARQTYLKSSTVANGSADPGRKRLRVKFVGFPGCTSTRT